MDGSGVPAKPAWGWLYVSTGLALLPFVLVARLVPERAARTLLEIGAALVLLRTLTLWVRANRVELEWQGRCDGGWRQAPLTVAAAAQSADWIHCDFSPLNEQAERAPGRGRGQDAHDGRHDAIPEATRESRATSRSAAREEAPWN